MTSISADEVMRRDAFELFGVADLEPSLQAVVDNRGRLSDDTIGVIDRLSRKLSLLFHPDRNPEGRDAFERVRLFGEQLKDPVQCLAMAEQKVGVAKGATAKAQQLSKAQAAGEALERRMAAEGELRRQQQAREAAELQANLAMMRGAGAGAGGGDAGKKGAAGKAQEIFERERRAQMTEWERLEEEMLEDWDVDSETLRRKELEIAGAMEWLEKQAAVDDATAETAPRRRNRE